MHPATEPNPVVQPRKRRRVFWWVFLAIQIVFLIWIITGVAGNGNTACNGLSAQDCAAASDTGTAIGVGLIIGLWVAVDIIVGGTYAVYRLARRGR